MDEYIEREKAIQICQSYYEHCLKMHDYCGDSVAYDIRSNIQGLPIADVVEVKHGEWINKSTCVYECSLCDGVALLDFKGEPCRYCPNCGAKMDLKEGAEE